MDMARCSGRWPGIRCGCASCRRCWSSGFFWHGLLTQIRRVFGLPMFVLAVLASFAAPRRGARIFIAALWIGYAAFAVAFTYHMPTHDYYHLPYVAVVALGVAATVERFQQWMTSRVTEGTLLRVSCAAAAAIAVWGGVQAWPRLTSPHAADTVASYERIGQLTNHAPNVLFLDLEYRLSLMYHGQLSGDSWPNADDLAAEAIDGEKPIPAAERFERDYAGFDPTYFVVTDLASLEAEPDLRQFLASHVTLVEKTPVSPSETRYRKPSSGSMFSIPRQYGWQCSRRYETSVARVLPRPRFLPSTPRYMI